MKGEKNIERFLNKTVVIFACLGEVDGSETGYKGVVTSHDDEYVCLDNKKYIVRKYIMSIEIK